MTNKEKCLRQWYWIVTHPGSTKKDWAKAHPVAAKEIEKHALCHACLDAYSRNTGCQGCPVQWSNNQYDHCSIAYSIYRQWNENKTSANAKAVLEVINRTWR